MKTIYILCLIVTPTWSFRIARSHFGFHFPTSFHQRKNLPSMIAITSSTKEKDFGQVSNFPVSLPVGLKLPAAITLATAGLLAGPLCFLTVHIPCLLWGLPYASIGSWKSVRSNGHRIGGIFTLIAPLFFVAWEAVTASHVPLVAYSSYIAMVLANVGFGAALIPKRIPAYDIPTLRAFAVGVLLALSFTTMSLYFRLGHLEAYKPIGTIFALLSCYTVAFAWSDGIQHLIRYLKGDFKEFIGKKWFLKFERPTIKHVYVDCIAKQPTAEALEASVTPANLVTVCTTVLTACFATIALLQTRYLMSGCDGLLVMAAKYPHIVRWSVYEALLAVVANNFGTFAGTLVLQGKLSQQKAGIMNALGLLIPVVNLLGFMQRYPGALQDLVITSLGCLL